MSDENDLSRAECPSCGGETEFVQFGGEDSDIVETTPEDVGDGLLELRTCLDCRSGVEFVLEPVNSQVLDYE